MILTVSGLLGAALIRFSPGYSASERQLDSRLSRSSLEALRREETLFNGTSRIYKRPVMQLVGERAATTIRSVSLGWIVAWAFAFALAALLAARRRMVALVASTLLSGALLSVPSAVLATICLLLGLPPSAAIAAVVFPRVFPYLYEQIRANVDLPHVTMARSRGLENSRIFFWHILPGAVSGILGLAAVSIPLALGASLPVEALADSPGLGQLAWRAALGRDLPVLVVVTLLLTAVTVIANLLSDIAIDRLGARAR